MCASGAATSRGRIGPWGDRVGGGGGRRGFFGAGCGRLCGQPVYGGVEKAARRPVSRVLCAPAGYPPRACDGHSSGTRLAARLARPTRAARRERLRGHGAKWDFVPCRRPPLFGLAPGGVCPAAAVTGGAVRSCRTISPLPAVPRGAGGLFSVALSLGSPPPAVSRHRIPVEPGLSSAVCRGSGRPAVWRGERCAGEVGFASGGMAWYRRRSRLCGRIAQLVEQLTLNQRVQGSSPCAPTN
jgi:hypothetical protein